MPELPEVETVRRVLEKNLVGLTIKDIEIRYSGVIEDDVTYFKNNVIEKKIIGMKRYGKYLIFELDKGYILSHLRMEGKYFYLKDALSDLKHVHVIYHFDNSYMLYYHDVRKFGKMRYIDEGIFDIEPIISLGVDPILDEVNSRDVYDKIKGKKIAIKTLLLDQSVITGLGNIYVDEVLFMARINPHKEALSLSFDDVDKICKASKEILSKAIICGGTTIRSYTSSLGVKGEYQNFLNVHTKDICPICKSKITKDKTNGRGTYYCPKCQKL